MDARELMDARSVVNNITTIFNVKTFDVSYAKYVKSKMYDKGSCLIYNDRFYRTKKDGIVKDVASECELITPEEGMSILKPFGIDDDPIGSIYCVTVGGSVFQCIYYNKTNKYTLLYESDYEIEYDSHDSHNDYDNDLKYPEVCLRCSAPLDPANEVVSISSKYIKCKYCGCANYPIGYVN